MPNWLREFNVNFVGTMGYPAGPMDRYWAALYWSVMTLTGIGCELTCHVVHGGTTGHARVPCDAAAFPTLAGRSAALRPPLQLPYVHFRACTSQMARCFLSTRSSARCARSG